MGRIHIVQCLCPQRHCIMAISWEEGGDFTVTTATAHLRTIVETAITDKSINPWCSICRSTRLRYEDGTTRFMSMEEAMPHLRRAETGNLIADILHGKH